MIRKSTSSLCSLVFAGLSLQSSIALALFEPGVGIGMEYSDNAALAPDNEEDDLIAIGYIGAVLEESRGPLTGSASGSLTYEHYTDNTFNDQYYFDLSATGGWEIVKDRLSLQARNYFTQRLRISVDAETPDNIEDTNIFAFGADGTLPISATQTLTIRPVFTDFYYEDSDTDNQRYSLLLDWSYHTSAITTVGLGGGVSKTDFEDEDRNPNFIASNIHAVISGQYLRSRYRVNLGATHIDRDRFENQNGFAGNLDWELDLTGRSSARIYMESDLTDSSYSALNSAIDPGRGDVDNEQTSGDVFRNNVLRAEYSRKGSTLDARVWGELRDLDYKETPDDREVQNLGLRLKYRVSPVISSGLYGKYKRTERTDDDRTDKKYTIGANFGYSLSRNMRSVFDIRYDEKDSTDDLKEYTEYSALISLVYGYGEVSRRRR